MYGRLRMATLILFLYVVQMLSGGGSLTVEICMLLFDLFLFLLPESDESSEHFEFFQSAKAQFNKVEQIKGIMD